MSEKLPHSGEHRESQANHEAHDKHHEALKGHLEKKAEQARHTHAEKLDEIRVEAAREAASSRETHHKINEAEKPENEQPMFVNRELKDMAYRRTLKRTQAKLPAPARALSKIIHQPAVEAVSELAAGTVARPSGILAGGVTSFIGSSLFLWVSKHYGYEYNFLLFALFFVGGFFVGLLAELSVRLLFKRHRS